MTTGPARNFSILLCLILAVCLYQYLPSLLAFAYVKWKLRDTQGLWLIPKPLSPEPLNYPAGPKLTYLGYEFSSPSAEVKEEKKLDSFVMLNFSDCAAMSIFRPSRDLVGSMQEEASKQGRTVQDIFGKYAALSNYALRSKTLNLTPGDLRLFSSRQEIAGTAVLLALKDGEADRFKNGFYSFATPWMRGFQEGDLARDKGVVVEAFDNQDQVLTLVVGAKPGKSCFAQPELNQIIFSLRPVPLN
jgi:hypothetical protein